ncbi:uncharacterized protein ATNIH1004_005357 [Aspergillus tanneri]|uniref:Tyrosine specific protein phosphatases domain-containing protein n=1 Tax=Aspergillus tanneri TaxID=1220188 RepID=A0A5M9MI67_9EURO|nr:uncharacterized protein ATNIH1004_005357 [Aspergillus tanneri]KAA8646682.1 hypothetical protein ATNIH1004_005357 [Aspergillus tanneri]
MLYTDTAVPEVPHGSPEKRSTSKVAVNPYYKVPDASWWTNEELREEEIKKDSKETANPLKEFLDVIEAPFEVVEETVKTFLQGIMNLAKGNTCEGVSETLMPVIHAMVKEFIKVSDETGFKSILNEIGAEITKFLNYPVIREGWKFLNTRLEDIPVVGLWFKTVGKAEGIRLKILLDFLLALGIDTIEHPTILDILLAIPGVGEFAEAAKAAEEGIKFAEKAARTAESLASITGENRALAEIEAIAKYADKADAAADAADAAANSAKGTEYEAKALKQAVKADKASKAADKEFSDEVEKAKKLCRRGPVVSWVCTGENASGEEAPGEGANRSQARRNRKERRTRRMNKKAETESETNLAKPQGQNKPTGDGYENTGNNPTGDGHVNTDNKPTGDGYENTGFNPTGDGYENTKTPTGTSISSAAEKVDFHRFKLVDEHTDPNHILARSSAPSYIDELEKDGTQELSVRQADFLKENGFDNIISLNSQRLSEAEEDLLKKRGIDYTHLPVKDFHPPTLDDLRTGVAEYNNHRATLVWCGFGHGRTGTMISAIQIEVNAKSGLERLTEDLFKKNHVEKESQFKILEKFQEERFRAGRVF